MFSYIHVCSIIQNLFKFLPLFSYYLCININFIKLISKPAVFMFCSSLLTLKKIEIIMIWRCGMNANRTSMHQMPYDVDLSVYISLTQNFSDVYHLFHFKLLWDLRIRCTKTVSQRWFCS